MWRISLALSIPEVELEGDKIGAESGKSESKRDKSDFRQDVEFRFGSLDRGISLGLLLLSFAVYLKHLAPSVHAGDAGEFCIASYVLGIPHPTGYPVYTWIGHLFTLLPLGSVAFRVNLMSAVFGAIAVSLIYLTALKLSKMALKDEVQDNIARLSAVIAALSFAFAITFWAQAEIAEVYTLNATLISAMLLTLLSWWEQRAQRLLYLLSLLLGISLGTHASNVLFALPFIGFVCLTDRRALMDLRGLAKMAALFALGALQFVYILLRAMQHPPYAYADASTVSSWLYFITAREYSAFAFAFPAYELPQRISMYIDLLAANFSLVGIAIGIAGIVLLARKSKAVLALLASMFLLNVWFFSQFLTGDVSAMFIPSYLIFSLFMCLGLVGILKLIRGAPDRSRSEIGSPNCEFSKGKFDEIQHAEGQTSDAERRSGRLTVALKTASIALVIAAAAAVPITSYSMNSGEVDQSGSIGFSFFISEAISQVPEDSTIITNWGPYTPLKYFQLVYGINPGAEVLGAEEDQWSQLIDTRLGKRDVYVLQADDYLAKEYRLIPVLIVPGAGAMYRVLRNMPDLAVSSPSIQHQLNRSLGGAVKLLGYSISSSEVNIGEVFSIAYYWQSTENTSMDYVVSTDFKDQDGNLAFQEVHAPVYGIYPTSQWRPGEILEEKYNISVPPNMAKGTYSISASGRWFPGERGLLEPYAGESDEIPLCSIKLV